MSGLEEDDTTKDGHEDESKNQDAQGTESSEEKAGIIQNQVDQDSSNFVDREPMNSDDREQGKGNVKEKTETTENEVVGSDQSEGKPTGTKQNDENVAEEQETVQTLQTNSEATMSAVISEPDKDVKTEEANAQTEGRGSPVRNEEGNVEGSPVKEDHSSLSKVMESQSESESPLIAPPTSQAEKSFDGETGVGNRTEFSGTLKDGFSASGTYKGRECNKSVMSKLIIIFKSQKFCDVKFHKII